LTGPPPSSPRSSLPSNRDAANYHSCKAGPWLLVKGVYVAGQDCLDVFQVGQAGDDTLLNTYDYTLAEQFGYSSATNQVWIDDAAFPAVFYMPQLVSFAAGHGYSIFYITGRPQSQTAATIKDLTSAGYSAPVAGHLFLKPTTPPSYLHCAAAPTCTTTEYKSGTRKYISSLGYTIIADFGDQYSDLLGGDAGHQVKLPNPMYYIP